MERNGIASGNSSDTTGSGGDGGNGIATSPAPLREWWEPFDGRIFVKKEILA
jgi:hypothetical protein